MDMTNIIEVATATLARTGVVRYFKKNDFFGLYIKINELVSFQKPSGIFDSTPLRNCLLPS
jgi:hypothetical protein